MEKKKKKQKENKKERPKVFEEWLYLSEEEALRRLYECLRADGKEAQLWEEAGVLEMPLAEGSSMDMEVLEKEQWDQELSLFAKQRKAERIYTVSFPEINQKEAYAQMKDLAEKAGGSFHKDTEAFLPEIKGR